MCKYSESDGLTDFCVNPDCPARADYCPIMQQEYQEICKYYEDGEKGGV